MVQQLQTIPTERSLKLGAACSLFHKDLQGFAVHRMLSFEFTDADLGWSHG